MRITAALLIACAIGFSTSSASAAITIQRAQISAGSLWIGGRAQPRVPKVIVKISPGSSIELNTRPDGSFSWRGKEFPTTCVVEIEGGGQSVKALVSSCGPQGPAGAAGATGPQGPTGSQGSAGPAGPAGPQGPAGPVGAQGPAGPAGSQGPAGPPGVAGAQGLQGIPGPPGLTGAASPPATTGPGTTGSLGPAAPREPSRLPAD